MSEIKKYYNSKNVLYAYVIPCDYSFEGINFVSDKDDYFQIATMSHKNGHTIKKHYHNIIDRKIDLTSEVLIIRKGVLKVTLYEDEKEMCDFYVSSGDILVLLKGGHGFEIVEDADFVEVKQGPFLGDIDKTRF